MNFNVQVQWKHGGNRARPRLPVGVTLLRDWVSASLSFLFVPDSNLVHTAAAACARLLLIWGSSLWGVVAYGILSCNWYISKLSSVCIVRLDFGGSRPWFVIRGSIKVIRTHMWSVNSYTTFNWVGRGGFVRKYLLKLFLWNRGLRIGTWVLCCPCCLVPWIWTCLFEHLFLSTWKSDAMIPGITVSTVIIFCLLKCTWVFVSS